MIQFLFRYVLYTASLTDRKATFTHLVGIWSYGSSYAANEREDCRSGAI